MSQEINPEIGSHSFDNLRGGGPSCCFSTRSVVLAAAQTLLRGAVLGLKTVVAAVVRIASITFSGTTAVGSGAVVLTVGATTYTYHTVTGDTPTVVAAALKALVNADTARLVNATNTAGKLILTFIASGANTTTVSATSADANVTAGATAADQAGVTAVDGEAVLVDSTKSDGSQVAKVILLESTDTTTGSIQVPVADAGSFNRAALVVGGTDTLDMHLDTLGRLKGNDQVQTTTNVAAVNQ